MSETPKPLAGLKVVELGTLIAGPFCTRIMAEFGAEVIKVEAPDGGDPLRKWRKLYEGTSLWWYVQARNKKSVTANLKHPDGLAFVRKLIAGADILVENFRPGVLEKLGLGWESLRADNPGLVMVRLSGFGQTGPYKDQPGFGAVGESMGGLRYITGFPERPPVRTGISIGDSIAALWGAIGALMALRHKEVNGGQGQVVDVALYEAVFAMMESLVPEFDVFGFVRERTGNIMPGITPSNTHTTQGRQARHHRRQRRCDLPPFHAGHRPARSGRRTGAGRQCRARCAARRDLCADRPLVRRTRRGHGAGDAGGGRSAGVAGVFRGQHVFRPAIHRPANVRVGTVAGRQGIPHARHRPEIVGNAGRHRMGGAGSRRPHRSSPGRAGL